MAWVRIGVAAAVMVIIAVRKQAFLAHPQFWAEDGAIFFVRADTHPLHGWELLFEPYQGYLHLVPRIIAALGYGLPLRSIPEYYQIVGLIAAGLTAWTLQSPRIRLPGAWVAAFGMALLPHSGEVYLTLCNLQWIGAIALSGLLIAEDASTRNQRVGDSVLLGLIGLTGPFVVLWLPLFAWRTWRRRSRWSTILLGIAVLCSVIQAPSLLNRPRSEDDDQPVQIANGIEVASRRLILSTYAGKLETGRAGAVALSLGAICLLAVALRRRRRELPGAGMLALAGVLVLGAVTYKARLDTLDFGDLFNGDRYYFVPKVQLCWLVGAVALADRGAIRWIAALCTVLPWVVNAPRAIYPAGADKHWPEAAARIEAGEWTHVDILPDGSSFEHIGRR